MTSIHCKELLNLHFSLFLEGNVSLPAATAGEELAALTWRVAALANSVTGRWHIWLWRQQPCPEGWSV